MARMMGITAEPGVSVVGSSDFTHNSPDPTKYHAQSGAVMIPIGIGRAADEGYSPAFDVHHPAGIMHVEPEALGDNHPRIDLSAVNKQTMHDVLAARPGSPMAAFAALSRIPAHAGEEEAMTPATPAAPHQLPNAVVVKSANQLPPRPAMRDGMNAQEFAALHQQPMGQPQTNGHRPPVIASLPAAPQQPTGQPQANPLAGVDPNLIATIAAAVLQQLQPPAPAPAPPMAMQQATPMPQQGVGNTFRQAEINHKCEGIGLPGVGLEQPIAPAQELGYIYPGVGNFAAQYHDILVGDGLMILIYDRRWSNASRFMPSQDVPFKVYFGDQQYDVVHGFNLALGALDVCVLTSPV